MILINSSSEVNVIFLAYIANLGLIIRVGNVDIQFGAEKLTQRSYTIAEILPRINRIELINKKKYVKMLLDKNLEIFVIYIIALKAIIVIKISIHLL